MGKYYDVPSVMQVIGAVYLTPSLLDKTEKYSFSEDDFNGEEFHRILFGTIYNLHQLGASEITPITIETYLEQRPKKYAVYQTNRGAEYLQKLVENTQLTAFDYYYQRVKKMTLLRMYNSIGLDVSKFYDIDNILDVKKKQSQEEWLDNHSLEEIAESINSLVESVRLKYVDSANDDYIQAGDGVFDLLNRLAQTPELGYPFFDQYFNTVSRGARLKKFYLRSASTGTGKTRAMIADCCYIGCNQVYDEQEKKWIKNGNAEPAIFISTEQEEDEIQTMMLAFLSAVEEEHILTGRYQEGEQERVFTAANVLKNSGIHIKKLPDFSLQDVENTIKYGIREWGCHFVCFDYIHSSMKILSEIGGRSGVKGLREDNILFLMSVKLKDICNEYGVFIFSSTQLNGGYQDADVYDQNLLRGAKSIADKIDLGCMMLDLNDKDRAALQDICATLGVEMPNVKMSIYKNRRGRYKDVLLWVRARKGICRFETLFVTDYNYQLIDIEKTKINITESLSSSAF